MKQLCKRSLALIMVLVMLIGILPSITFQTQAASYTYNWGTRGTVATELSDAAVSWYEKYNTSYAELSALNGSSSVSSVPSSALYSELQTLMTNAHSYKTSYDATKNLYQYTDCQNGGGKISSFYSGTLIGPGWGEGGSWNREHTWPNSKGLGGQDENDIMMLRPTTTAENSSRGNEAYGKSGSYYDPNDDSNGKYNLHGDVARIMLYVYVRWGNTSKMWGSAGVMESKEVLLEWMEEDPVDTWELGRNDAVQSITGTRNVFVDYPELAFDLFNAEIPNDYDTPSGSAPSFTIVATSNNTAYGTISMSGKTITATPKTGYQVAGYKILSGSATVTRSGNTFTVSANSDCSIQIIFEPRVKTTLTFVDQGMTVATLTPYTGDSTTLPAYTGTAPDGFIFRGWVDQEIENSETKPTIYAENSSYTVSAEKTFYALYAKVEEGSTGDVAYRLVTDMSQLSEGASVVIAAAGTTAIAMKSTGGTNNRYAGTVTKNADDTITFTESALIDVLTLGTGSTAGTYSFYSEANSMYLAAGTSSGSNILKLQSSVDAAASFTISVSSDGTATVNSKTSSDRNLLQYNSSANIFSCYGSAQKAISLYVQSGGGVAYYTTSPITCDHADTENVQAVAATCTESGYTAGVYCNDCNRYISGHEVVEALGHSFGSWITTTQPTCTAAGVQTKTCSACGATTTQSVAATGHSYDSGKITTEATCTANGVKTYTCSKCGGTKTESVAATGHNYVLTDGVYTCTGCGDGFDAVYVEFSVPAGVEKPEKLNCTDGSVTLPNAGVPQGEYTFVGWTKEIVEDTMTEPTVYQAGQSFTSAVPVTLYALYSYAVESEEGGSGDYVKVTQAPDDWSGEYLIVYEDANYIFDGSLSKLDAAKNYKEVTISNGTISAAQGDPYKFIIEKVEGGYSVQSVGGIYIGRTSTSNGLNESTTTAYAHTITLDSSGNAKLTSVSGPYLNFNALTDQLRFRYYKSGQKPIQLYVKDGVSADIYYTSLTEAKCQHSEETCVDTLPTCTEEGYTTYYCADCGEELYVEDYVAALGHTFEEGKCTVCGEADPDYVPPVVLPSGDATLKFKGAYLKLEADLTVAFQVMPHVFANGAYENPRVEYSIPDVLNNNVRTAVVTEYTIASDGRLNFPFKGISPRMMKAPITATVYGTYQGVEYSYTMTYALTTYAYNQLGKTTDATFKTLLADLLNFGTAHQRYAEHDLENLINAEMTEDQKAAASSYALDNLEDLQNTKYAVIDNPTAKFNSAALVYLNAVVVRLTFTCADTTNASLHFVCDGVEYDIPASEWVPVSGYTDRYQYDISALMAKQMSSAIHATIFRNGAAISNTLQYSIETYICRNLNNTEYSEVLRDLLKYTIYYGNSAAAYFS